MNAPAALSEELRHVDASVSDAAGPQSPADGRSGAELAESCQGLVRAIAWQIHRRLPPQVELDDLIGYGQVGVSQAARDYDGTRGASFTTFAYYRIRGAILDGLSQMSWFSRADYHARKFEARASDVLALEAEEAHDRGGPVEHESVWFGRAAGTLTIAYLTSAASPAETIEDERAAPEQDIIGQEVLQRLRALIEALPGDAGNLIRLTYFEDMTLQEAATRLGISKSWASRLHAKTLRRLGRSLHQMGVE